MFIPYRRNWLRGITVTSGVLHWDQGSMQAWYSTNLYSTVQYSTVQYSAVQHKPQPVDTRAALLVVDKHRHVEDAAQQGSIKCQLSSVKHME